MSALMTRIQQALDDLAAEHGANHVHISRTSGGMTPIGRWFYTVQFQDHGFVRSAHGGTLAEALSGAIAATPFDARPALSETEMAELIAGDEAAERRTEAWERAKELAERGGQ